MSTLPNLIAELSLRFKWHVTWHLHVISARCVARDLHTVASEPLERTCWRQFAALWGDCKKSRIAPLNGIIIIADFCFPSERDCVWVWHCRYAHRVLLCSLVSSWIWTLTSRRFMVDQRARDQWLLGSTSRWKHGISRVILNVTGVIKNHWWCT